MAGFRGIDSFPRQETREGRYLVIREFVRKIMVMFARNLRWLRACRFTLNSAIDVRLLWAEFGHNPRYFVVSFILGEHVFYIEL